ncbi:MAG TPA: DUF2568 domain-containing protein [Ktedonobacterales bacterium]|nr:DUF2568 domain-containing protein [Ktedonobacterales bacterium]
MGITPLVVAVLWGLFMAPRAVLSASRPIYWLLFVVFIGAAALALAFVGQPALAIIFAVVVILNRALTPLLKEPRG